MQALFSSAPHVQRSSLTPAVATTGQATGSSYNMYDESFQSLLSSQRELLHQLNIENALRREQEQLKLAAKKASKKQQKAIIDNNNSCLTTSSANVVRNNNIDCFTSRRSSMDLLYPGTRRFSLAMGFDNIVLPDLALESERIDLGYDDSLFISSDAKHQQDFMYGDLMMTYSANCMKRRMSNFGITPTFFEDYLKPTSRRGSLFTAIDPNELSNDCAVAANSDKDDDNSSEDEDSVDSGNTTNTPTTSAAKKFDPADLKKTMQSFTSAMERSQQTQQEIHDWDRKMGLKRSHSKTMRLSSRSRKKLRTMLKKEINTTFAS